MAEITLVGLSASDPVPGNYVEINFAQGDVSLGTATRVALLLGNKTSAGSATADTVIYGPDTPVTLGSEADAISLFGTGSELHRMWRRFVSVNQTTPLYAIAVAEGGSATQSTGTITVATNATSAATLRIYVGDEYVEVGFITGDTPTVIATAAVAAISAQTHWPVTATNVAGVITITSKNASLRSNQIRYFAKITPGGVGTTVTPTASTAMASGTVNDSLTNALATILARKFYYIIAAQNDSTNLGALISQVNTQALATTGIRQRVFAGFNGSIANCITLSTALNAFRHELIWLNEADYVTGELAANNAAVYSLHESSIVPLLNFNSYGGTPLTAGNWKIKAPLSGAAPTRAQIFSALNSGITPIGVYTSGGTYLVRRITTRFLTSNQPDYRTRDAGKVTVCDFYGDDLQAKVDLQLSHKLIADDPKKNEPEPAPNVVTPRVLKALINRLTRDYGENALVARVGEIIAGTVVQRSVVPTRMNAQIPLQPIDILNQTAMQVNQVA